MQRSKTTPTPAISASLKMKTATVFTVLLSTTVAFPFTIPISSKAEVTTRDVPTSTNILFATKYRKDLINDPQKRAAEPEEIFPVRYNTDAAQDSGKRAENVGFPTKYRKDLINGPQKRAVTPIGFSVSYKKDVIDSKAPVAKLEKR